MLQVLQISYDESLLRSRHLLLEAEGYAVSSVMRFEQARELCDKLKFRLVIIGHSIPAADKQQFITELKSRCLVPILALVRDADALVPEADYNLHVSTGPAQLIATVNKLCRGRVRAA